MGVERRNIAERAAVVRQVINSIVQNPSVTLSVTSLQSWLGTMLCSWGGEIWTALNPAGPRKLSHSAAMSVQRHSKRCTKTSPAAMCPLGR